MIARRITVFVILLMLAGSTSVYAEWYPEPRDAAATARQRQDQKQGQGQEQGQIQDATNAGNTQTINSGSNLIQLPGVISAYPNFTQPYKPDVYINGAGAIRPSRMTYEQADRCAKGLGFWGVNDDYIGTAREGVKEISLSYPAWDHLLPTADMTGFVGVSLIRTKDKPWLSTLCAAAKTAMDKGSNTGIVEFVIRPVNKTNGAMVGAAVGGSGLSGGATPYALAGTVSAGVGTASTFVQGELMLQITGMKDDSLKKKADSGGLQMVSYPPRMVVTPDGQIIKPPVRPAIPGFVSQP